MFPEKERRVFQYWNGRAQVWGDPLRIERELYAALGDPDACFRDAKLENTDRVKQNAALACIYDNAREVFAMVPFDPATGEGATEEDMDAALSALWVFLAAKKKSIDSSPTSSAPTASSPPAS